ncbi:large conductance mechanosensitive channel protein MscL [Lacticaseibacillus zhaodongensis]|uniref:large conductance mechanosensitive channel protein MscL n=1 Tax=Lacticaseibacillus zhaodongensis TaxID=2668065 RepID=UPI0012D2F047|nr:large conductance mechanosensitive channel protein MscL [Lacticaseibacillus zhaodongensis]
MLKEFRDFIMRGNMLDMAVGVIIGGAFTALVGSLTKNLISPLLSLFVGKANLSAISFTVLGAQFKIGTFVDDIINFIIMAFVVFLLVRTVNKLRKPKSAAPAGPTEAELLLQIRDLLAEQKGDDTKQVH